jgi:DNA-binding HxlR family transcriptional regulator
VLGRSYEAQNCSAARTLELVGERWSLLILRDAIFRGMTRFSEFQRSLGVAPNVLSARLQGFCEEGLLHLEKASGSDQPRYRVTDKGRDLAPVIIALTAWGDRWAAPNGPPVRFAHHSCDGTVTVELRCRSCGQQVPATDLEARPQQDSAWQPV